MSRASASAPGSANDSDDEDAKAVAAPARLGATKSFSKRNSSRMVGFAEKKERFSSLVMYSLLGFVAASNARKRRFRSSSSCVIFVFASLAASACR